MRKRIRELAEGRVECAKPMVEFSAERIEIDVVEGTDYRGEFTLTSTNQVPVRGIACSLNPRMKCLTVGFEGEEVRIRYEFHSAGLTEGNIQKGEFVLICSQEEYHISFAVTVTKQFSDSSVGMIKSLPDFVRLAQKNWQEARKIFYGPSFLGILKKTDMKQRLLYEGLSKTPGTGRAVEEFLLACGLKEQVVVTVNQTEYMFEQVAKSISQDVPVVRNTWGYVEFEVASDAKFIKPKKNWITMEDFLGSEADAGFYLDPDCMHAGKNFGRLILKNMHQELTVFVCAVPRGSEAVSGPARREIRQCYVKLQKLYVQYRLKEIGTGKWASAALKILDDLIVRDSGNAWYRLLKAQTFWLNGQKQETEWILDEFKRKWKDRTNPRWGYYLYICTLMEREDVYIDRLTGEIGQIYLEHAENPVLFWCLLFLRKEYAQNRYQKLKALEERIMGGWDSPILYAEAYVLFLAEPYLMNRLGDFEEKILNWARKQNALTKEIAGQAVSVFPMRKAYKKRTFLLLEACYKQTEDIQALKVICEYLIRSQAYGRGFFSWYALGVEKKLRITGLYEAYLLSMDTRNVQDVPQIIQMYFKYNNQLGYRQKAILYVNIIASKTKQPNVYEQHFPSMEKFAAEQMALCHMDDNLAVIYADVLSHGIYFAEVSDALADVLFVHRLTCFEPQAAKVMILQEQLTDPAIVPIYNGEAYFPLYTNDYVILIEDLYGNRYAGSVSYQLEKLMYPGRYIRGCMQLSPGRIPFLLYYFANRRAQEFFEEKDLKYFQALMESPKINPAYRAWLFPKMFGLLFFQDETEEMRRELSRVDLSFLTSEERGRILEMCIEKQLYGQAYKIASEYGFEPLSVSMRVRLLNNRISRAQFAENEDLVQYCADTFLAGKYNDTLLEYLCRYYQGPANVMALVFQSAQVFYIDTQELAERILVQMLYTAGFFDCVGAVYKSYEASGSPLVKKAYLTYFCFHSFVHGIALPDGFYAALKSFWLDERDLAAVCELELLRYYSFCPPRQQKEIEIEEELLKRYVFQGICFAFYKNLNAGLQMKYQLNDKYFIEYHACRHRRIKLCYALGDDRYIEEELPEVMEGIYVKAFTLFWDETVQYYIIEESDGQKTVTESGILQCKPVKSVMQDSRYERLNEMIMLKTYQKTELLQSKMLEFEHLEHMAGESFTIL